MLKTRLQVLHLIDAAHAGSPKGQTDVVALLDGKQYPVSAVEFRTDPTARFNRGKMQFALTLGEGRSDEPYREPSPAGAPVATEAAARGATGTQSAYSLPPEVAARIEELEAQNARLGAQVKSLTETRPARIEQRPDDGAPGTQEPAAPGSESLPPARE